MQRERGLIALHVTTSHHITPQVIGADGVFFGGRHAVVVYALRVSNFLRLRMAAALAFGLFLSYGRMAPLSPPGHEMAFAWANAKRAAAIVLLHSGVLLVYSDSPTGGVPAVAPLRVDWPSHRASLKE